MKFGPADFMDGLKALILVMAASAVIKSFLARSLHFIETFPGTARPIISSTERPIYRSNLDCRPPCRPFPPKTLTQLRRALDHRSRPCVGWP
jgi:hypothetical protein